MFPYIPSKYLFRLLSLLEIWDKVEFSKKIESLILTWDIFHLEISDNFNKSEHPSNIPLISVTLEVFHIEISGIEVNDEQSENNFSYILYYMFSI